MGTQQPWEQIVLQKRAIRDKLLSPYLVNDVERRAPRVNQVQERSRLSQEEAQTITDIDNLAALQKHIQNGDFTSEQVVSAYIQRWERPFPDGRSASLIRFPGLWLRISW